MGQENTFSATKQFGIRYAMKRKISERREAEKCPKRFSGRFRVRPRFARAVSYIVWRSLPGSTQRHERSEWLCGVKAAPLVIDKHTPWCQTKFYNKQYLITYVVLYFVNKEAV